VSSGTVSTEVGATRKIPRRAGYATSTLLLALGLLSCSFPDYTLASAPATSNGGLTTGGSTSGGAAGTSTDTAGTATGGLAVGGSAAGTAASGGSPPQPGNAGAETGGSGGGTGSSSGAGGEAGAGGAGAPPKLCGDYEELPADCSCQEREGHAYLFCSTARSWPQAELRCGFYDMTLAKLESPQEDAWLLKQAHGLSDPRPLTFFWIGASSQDSPGTWHWADGVEFWRGSASGDAIDGAYYNWRVSSPQNTQSAACVFSDDNGWEDGDCAINRGYVCEAQ